MKNRTLLRKISLTDIDKYVNKLDPVLQIVSFKCKIHLPFILSYKMQHIHVSIQGWSHKGTSGDDFKKVLLLHWEKIFYPQTI